MKNRDKIEKYMSNLASQDSQTPPAFVWDEIEQHLDDKDSRKIAWWWILIPIVLLVIPAYLLLFSGADTTEQDSSYVETPNTEIQQNQESKSAPSKELDLPKSEISVPNDEDNRQLIASDNLKEKTQEIKSTDLAYIPSTAKVYEEEKTATLESTLSEDNTVNNTISSALRANQNSTGQNTESLETNAILKDNSTIAAKSPEAIGSTFIGSSATKGSDRSESEKEIEKESVAKVETIRLVTLPLLDAKLDITHDVPTFLLTPLEVPIDLEREQKDNSPWFIGLDGFAGIQQVDFTPRLDNNLSSFRQEMENDWYSWGADLELGYQLSDRFYVSTGLSYRELKSKFDYELRSISETYVDTFFLAESISITDTLFFNRGETKHRLLNIPLLLGYQYQHNKFFYGAELGVSLNIQAAESGKVYIGARNIARLEDLDYAKSSVGVSLLFNATLGYQLTDKFTLMLKPGIRYQLADTYRDSSPYGKNFSLVGSSIGMRYRF